MALLARALWFVNESPLRRRIDQLARRGRFGPARCFPELRERLAGKRGLEIGGPSSIFRPGGILPVYPSVGALDGCNFGEQTVWEGTLAQGGRFEYLSGRPAGRQIIAEATVMKAIDDAHYDFVISSHCLEHVANPLKALVEWRRIIRPGGTLLLVVPDPRLIFDRKRPVTTFAHLTEDYERDVGEDDMTHFDEIMQLHDLSLDPAAGTPDQFRARSLENAKNRCFHQHIFTPELASEAVRWAGFKPMTVELNGDFHIIVVAERPA